MSNTVIVVLLFAGINVHGASETGTVGNVITIAKAVILLIFVAFGIRAMIINPNLNVFTHNFMPHGLAGVFVAMGLTFIAFEGYEIISQSGEEVINPMRNIPRAIFISIGIVVVIYVLVAILVIGATVVPKEFDDMAVWDYLAQAREVAIVRTAEQIMGRLGGLLSLISGLASAMSALNATIYSLSRFSFAMGRDHNLPSIFGCINPRYLTPVAVILISAVFIRVVKADSPLNGILAAAEDCDLIVIGATQERLVRNLLMGNVAEQVAEQADCPVMIVKRRSSPVASVLRETVLPPVRSEVNRS